jgi:hypothetical protein
VRNWTAWSLSRSAQNTLASVPAAQRAASDADGDGIGGLAEFAFGLDPGAPDATGFAGSLTGPESARGLPVLRVARAFDGLDYMELQFPRRVGAGLTYQMQSSANTGTWTAAGTIEVLRPLGPGWELCRTRDPVPMDNAQARRFLRLRVTQP